MTDLKAPETIAIDLTVQDIEIILNALAQQPYIKVAPIIQMFQERVSQELEKRKQLNEKTRPN